MCRNPRVTVETLILTTAPPSLPPPSMVITQYFSPESFSTSLPERTSPTLIWVSAATLTTLQPEYKCFVFLSDFDLFTVKSSPVSYPGFYNHVTEISFFFFFLSFHEYPLDVSLLKLVTFRWTRKVVMTRVTRNSVLKKFLQVHSRIDFPNSSFLCNSLISGVPTFCNS